jgi:hypothetical protein
MRTVDPCVAHQGGDDQLLHAACILVIGFDLTPDQALPYLRDYNQKCNPPWPESRLLYKVSQADKQSDRRGGLRNQSAPWNSAPSGQGNRAKPAAQSLPYKPACEEEPPFVASIKQDFAKDVTEQSAEHPTINWPEASITSTAAYNKHKAVYPADSILDDYMAFVREECEAADAFILGAILPVCAALLGRKVRFPWGSTIKFPNIFTMLAGPAGDRKTSAMEIARNVAQECLPPNTFLPGNFSPESLFDEYDSEKGGRPDKLWIVDDANIVLTDWRQTSNGERGASRFLSLYDCGSLTENFRRNQNKNQSTTRRTIPQTTTSMAFAGTYNVACFQGQAVRAGIARRFLFYVAEGFGRIIEIPKARAPSEFGNLTEMFSRLNSFSACMQFSSQAERLWIDYQHDNRQRKLEADTLNDAECSRLASEPMQTLSIAMIFQACVCAKQRLPLSSISFEVLSCAIHHMMHNLESARYLDSISDRESVRGSAEILLAKIRKDFKDRARNGTILLTRSDIRARYAPHSARQGAWTPNDIFLKFLPALIRQGEAKLDEKKGKTEIYAIRADH